MRNKLLTLVLLSFLGLSSEAQASAKYFQCEAIYKNSNAQLSQMIQVDNSIGLTLLYSQDGRAQLELFTLSFNAATSSEVVYRGSARKVDADSFEVQIRLKPLDFDQISYRFVQAEDVFRVYELVGNNPARPIRAADLKCVLKNRGFRY